MRFLIVEDETLLAKKLTTMLQALEPQSKIAAYTNSIESTVAWLRQNNSPDLIFMDIELADGQCFKIFEQVSVKAPIIFTTAYNEHALRAFKVNSVDYLLKPIRESELRSALDKWNENLCVKNATLVPEQLESLIQELKKPDAAPLRERFLVKQGSKMVAVAASDIAYFSAKDTLNFLVTHRQQKFIVGYTLDELENMVDPRQFFRVNRQYIVAQSVVSAIHPWLNGRIKLDISVPIEAAIVISREKAQLFKEWMGA